MSLALLKCNQYRYQIPVDGVQQHQRRPLRAAVTTLPVPQCCHGKPETGSELLRGQCIGVPREKR